MCVCVMSKHFSWSHSASFIFPTLPGASNSRIFLEICSLNWLSFWLALTIQGHVSFSLSYWVSYLPGCFPTSNFCFQCFLVHCHFLCVFYSNFYFWECLYCHHRGIWKGEEKTTCALSAIFNQMSSLVVWTGVLFVCLVLFCLPVWMFLVFICF